MGAYVRWLLTAVLCGIYRINERVGDKGAVCGGPRPRHKTPRRAANNFAAFRYVCSLTRLTKVIGRAPTLYATPTATAAAAVTLDDGVNEA